MSDTEATPTPASRLPLIFDAGALLAYLLNEDGAKVVESLLLDSENTLFVHAVNLCEVYYALVRAEGRDRALAIVKQLVSTGLQTRNDMDVGFWQEAGELKAEKRRISLADCYCLTLAQRLSGEVVTSDHHEMDALAALGTYSIRFIR